MDDADRMPVRLSDDGLQRRWVSVRHAMRARGIDALVMQSSNDWLGGAVRWFTDLPATNGYPRTVLFFADGDMVCIEMGVFDGRTALRGSSRLHRGVDEILTTPSFTSVAYTETYDAAHVVSALRKRGCRSLGVINPGSLPAAFARTLTDGMGEACVIHDATEWIDALKAIKSEEDRRLIEATAQLQDEVFADALAGIRPGMRDIDVTARAQHAGQLRGSEQGILLGGSAPLGRASVFLPRFLQGRELQQGDHLSLLIEINGPGGFYTEIARTIVLGRASAELEDGFAQVCAAQTHTLSLLVPGASCREIAAAHDAFMVARGLAPELRLYSHGQGYDMVERPLIRHDETMNLAAGMCLAVHPGITTPRIFAVICDNYFVGPDGASDCLHRTEKRLFEV